MINDCVNYFEGHLVMKVWEMWILVLVWDDPLAKMSPKLNILCISCVLLLVSASPEPEAKAEAKPEAEANPQVSL